MTNRLWVIFAILVAVSIPAMAAGDVWVFTIDGEIGSGTVSYLRQGMAEAGAARAQPAVIVLAPPGGWLDAAVEARRILLESEIPTVAYIDREAFSAGAMLAIACERIIFAPGGVMGAATPVYIRGEEMREAPEKVISATRKLFRSAAETFGRPPEVAEAMVDRDVEIPGLVEAGKLLTLTAAEAAEWGYSDGEANRLEDWLESAGHGEATLVEFETRWVDELIETLTSPIAVGILITLGILGLIAEMMIPGFGIPGIIGIVCLGAFFWSHFLVGLAGWESIAFLMGGLVAVILEIFVFTAVDFGAVGLLGLVSIGFGFYTAMIGPLATGDQIGQAIGIIVGGIVVSLIVLVVLLTKLPTTRLRFGGVILSTAITGRSFGPKKPSDKEASTWLDRRGTAATDLRPVGTGVFDGERTDVICEEGHLPKGTQIVVIKDEGYRRVVRRDDAAKEG